MLKKSDSLLSLLAGTVIGITFAAAVVTVFEIPLVAVEKYQLAYIPSVSRPAVYAIGALAGLLMVFGAYKLRQREGEEFSFRYFLGLGWPGFLFLPLLLLKVNFLYLLLFLLVCGLWGLVLGGSLYRGPLPKVLKYSFMIVPMAWSIMILCGIWMQYVALDSLYMINCDMQCFLEATRSTLEGNWFMLKEPDVSFFSRHFTPGLILFLLPWVWLLPMPYTLIVLNTLLLYSCPVVLYILCRKLKLGKGQSLILAGCMILSPSLACLNISLIYGFHEVILMMPLLVGYFIARESGRRGLIIAWLIFGFSLLIKETIPVFWFGIGIVFILSGKRRDGIIISCVSLLYFLLVLKLVIPWFSPEGSYMYSSHYTALGSSTFEIALSPFTKPKVFFGLLLRPNCLYFLLMLLMPVFFLTLRHPLLLLGGAVTFVFICLSNGNVQNICMQYQAEIVCLVFINAVYALKRINEECGSKQWWKQPSAFLVSSLILSVGCWFFYAQSPFTRNNLKSIMNRPSWGSELVKIKEQVPPGAEFRTSTDVIFHFFWRNPSLYPRFEEDPYVLLNLNSNFMSQEDIDSLRDFFHGRGYRVIYSQSLNPVHLVLFTNTGNMPGLRPFSGSAAEFEQLPGYYFDTGDLRLRGKAKLTQTDNGIVCNVDLLLTDHMDHDADVVIWVKVDGEEYRSLMTFANGLLPAFLAEKGQYYRTTLELPPGNYQDITIQINPRAKFRASGRTPNPAVDG